MKPSPTDRPHLYPDLEDWPIYKLHANRDGFVDELSQEAYAELLAANPKLVELLPGTIYSEKTRVRKEPWKVDPPGELTWWRRLERKLVKAGLDADDANEEAARRELLSRVVKRYAEGSGRQLSHFDF